MINRKNFILNFIKSVNLGKLIVILTICSFGAFTELKFVQVFTKLIADDTLVINEIDKFDIVLASAAPLTFIFYYLYAWFSSISFCNKLYVFIIPCLKYEHKSSSEVKMLVEDFNLCHQNLIFPLHLVTYRIFITLTLLSSSFILMIHEFGFLKVFILAALALLALFIALRLLRIISKRYSVVDNKRLAYIDQVIGNRLRKDNDKKTLEKITYNNYRTYFLRIFIQSIGTLAKPAVDFLIIISIFLVVFTTETQSDGLNSTYVALGLSSYRVLGPALNILSNFNQIQFGWFSLTPEWRTAVKKFLRSSL